MMAFFGAHGTMGPGTAKSGLVRSHGGTPMPRAGATREWGANMPVMAERVRITDVSPRDGLQNEPGVIPTAEKVRLIELLCATGVDEIEVTSFVSPKWVPQLGDAEAVFEGMKAIDITTTRAMFSALVPNEKGMIAAEAVRMKHRELLEKVSVFTAASETFCKRNINATIAESIERFGAVLARAKSASEDPIQDPIPVRGYISCIAKCPFEGQVAPEAVARVARSLAELGVDEIDLGDTIGAATPADIKAILKAVRAEVPVRLLENISLVLHLHDTFGHAAECVKAALDLGIRSFDGSVAGLGGCPYASTPGKRAPGNISTETLVRTIEHAGYTTGVNIDRMAEAADYARQIVARARAQADTSGAAGSNA